MAIRDALRKARLLEQGKKIEKRSTKPKHFAIMIHSNLLNENIWLLSDEEMCRSIDDDRVVYLADEIQSLIWIEAAPNTIRKIHMVKRVFPGSKIVWN